LSWSAASLALWSGGVSLTAATESSDSLAILNKAPSSLRPLATTRWLLFEKGNWKFKGGAGVPSEGRSQRQSPRHV